MAKPVYLVVLKVAYDGDEAAVRARLEQALPGVHDIEVSLGGWDISDDEAAEIARASFGEN